CTSVVLGRSPPPTQLRALPIMAPGPEPQGEPTKEERLWAAGGHLSGYFLPALGPLLVLLVKGDSPYARAQAFQALNYHLNLIIADRKSTRLKSSHVKISYAALC